MQQQPLKTLLLIKPGTIKRKIVGNILSIIEKHEFNIVDAKLLQFNLQVAQEFYKVHQKKYFFNDLIEYIISDKIIAFILEKENAIKELRELTGATNPEKAKEGTIRKLYALNERMNAVHSSDSIEHAKQEIKIIFPEHTY